MRAIQGREIAMIFQEPMTAFSPVHTIGSQIDEMIALHVPRPAGVGRREAKRWVRARTIAMLHKVGMPSPDEIAEAYPHNLSGGMRQRAMIAMALSCNPRILVADEPTTALDVTLQAQVLGLMREMIRDFHTSVVFITHDLGVVAEIADRVVVMYLGRVVESAPVDDLFYAPKHPYTQALIRSVPRTSGPIEKLVPIEGTVPSPLDMPEGCTFHTRCPFVMKGLCDARVPELREVAGRHSVACFLHQPEVLDGRS